MKAEEQKAAAQVAASSPSMYEDGAEGMSTAVKVGVGVAAVALVVGIYFKFIKKK